MSDTRTITVNVNGAQHTRTVPVRLLLSDFLRHELLLTGTHVGCEHGVCGACTILFDGRTARSCLTLAVQANNKEIVTVEGVAPSATELHPLQQAMQDHHGLQCGFCTPGFVMTLVELLRDNPKPTEHEVVSAISGNLCRCTGYSGIVEAALDATGKMRR
jgi:carbon-monoxide dehydrogenase small subunit